MSLLQVASLFCLHDLQLTASAEPTPPDGDFDTEDYYALLSIYEGALVLYHLNLEYEVISAVEALQNVNYRTERLDDSICQILLDALEDSRGDIDVAADDLDWDYDRAVDARDALQEALQSRLDNSTATANLSSTISPSQKAPSLLSSDGS